MKFIRLAALLLLCICLLPACTNDEQPDDFEMPETHADAIDPNAIKTAKIVHYTRDGAVDFEITLEAADSVFVPLLATVYDKATAAEAGSERIKRYEVTLTGEGIEIDLVLYSDQTMDTGSSVLDAADMDAFLRSFLPIPVDETTAA